ncbi:AAA family ATPase [Sphingomonas sp.]|uniref:AAA family ATPase n=1 Tax=Sphingomonas sp. TaxID=28214 RepID=UPI0035BC6C35
MTKTLSLLERAAAKYDFGAPARAPVPVELANRVPVNDTTSRHPGLDPGSRFFLPPEGSGTPAQGRGDGGVEAALSPNSPDEFDLSHIPPELREGASEDEPYLPPLDGPVAIDRLMLAERGMIVPGAPVGPLAEEFRLVKRQLLITAGRIADSDTPDKARSVLVCSAKPGEGKTFCSLNLALSVAAERDTEVLLIDADFAKPDVMAQLGLADSPGLLDALADPSLDPEALVVGTDVPHLSILPAGSRMAIDTELLASARTRAVIARLLAANPRRLLIFDSPPALAASPAAVLAMLVGQVMLVVRADRTPENEVREAVSLLDGCEHIALVLNAVSFVPGGARFGSYYGQEDRS